MKTKAIPDPTPFWKKQIFHQERRLGFFNIQEICRGPLVVESGKMYFSTITDIFCIDLNTGNHIFQIDIPEILQADRLQVDNLQIRGNLIYLARENGLVSYNMELNKIEYYHYIYVYTAFYFGIYILQNTNEYSSKLKKRKI